MTTISVFELHNYFGGGGGWRRGEMGGGGGSDSWHGFNGEPHMFGGRVTFTAPLR